MRTSNCWIDERLMAYYMNVQLLVTCASCCLLHSRLIAGYTSV